MHFVRTRVLEVVDPAVGRLQAEQDLVDQPIVGASKELLREPVVGQVDILKTVVLRPGKTAARLIYAGIFRC